MHLTASFITGIALLFRRKVLCGVVFCGQSVLFSGATILFALFYSLLFMFFGVDHFADNLKLPEGVELQEPLEIRPLVLNWNAMFPKMVGNLSHCHDVCISLCNRRLIAICILPK